MMPERSSPVASPPWGAGKDSPPWGAALGPDFPLTPRGVLPAPNGHDGGPSVIQYLEKSLASMRLERDVHRTEAAAAKEASAASEVACRAAQEATEATEQEMTALKERVREHLEKGILQAQQRVGCPTPAPVVYGTAWLRPWLPWLLLLALGCILTGWRGEEHGGCAPPQSALAAAGGVQQPRVIDPGTGHKHLHGVCTKALQRCEQASEARIQDWEKAIADFAIEQGKHCQARLDEQAGGDHGYGDREQPRVLSEQKEDEDEAGAGWPRL